MIRPLTILTLCAAAGAGLWLYQVKHSVAQLDRELREVNRRTEQARERTQVLRAVRATVQVPVLVRVSATDWVEPEGLTLAESVTVAQWAREAGADLYDVSTGGVAPGIKIPTAPGYQVPFATAIREGAGIPVGAVGQITNAVQAEEIVSTAAADVVFVARQFLRDPHLPLRWAHELGAEIEWPAPYRRATRWP